MRCRAFSLIEGIVALALAVIVIGTAFAVWRSSSTSLAATLGPQMDLQMATRKALLEFTREIQESIEIVRPRQGATLSYLVARDKLNRILVCYQVKNESESVRAGRPLHDVFVYRDDRSGTPPRSRQRLLFGSIERLTFTALGSGVAQIHMDIHEKGRTYAVLTSVRSRNIATEGDL